MVALEVIDPGMLVQLQDTWSRRVWGHQGLAQGGPMDLTCLLLGKLPSGKQHVLSRSWR